MAGVLNAVRRMKNHGLHIENEGKGHRARRLKTTARFGCADAAEKNAEYTFEKIGFHYQVKEVYLGFEGSLDSIDGNMRIILSYTVRDGVFLNIKTLNPWKVLFEYADGAYFSTGANSNEFDGIVEALQNLQSANDTANEHEVYVQMEKIVLAYLLEHASALE